MKRFFCKTCLHVRRCRRMPVNVDSPFAQVVEDRIGICERHFPNHSNKQSFDRTSTPKRHLPFDAERRQRRNRAKQQEAEDATRNQS